jgi:hypothetical protein
VRLLWTNVALSVAAFFADPQHSPTESAMARVAIVVISFGLFAIAAWLIFKIGQGRNWARWAYLVLAVLGYLTVAASWQTYVNQFTASPITAVLFALQLATEIPALYLLFTKPGREWFDQLRYR